MLFQGRDIPNPKPLLMPSLSLGVPGPQNTHLDPNPTYSPVVLRIRQTRFFVTSLWMEFLKSILQSLLRILVLFGNFNSKSPFCMGCKPFCPHGGLKLKLLKLSVTEPHFL